MYWSLAFFTASRTNVTLKAGVATMKLLADITSEDFMENMRINTLS